MAQEVLTFVVLAGLAEAVTEVLVQLIEGIRDRKKEGNQDWWKLPIACVVAGGLLYLAGLNIFVVLGVPLRIGSTEFQFAIAALLGGILVGRWGGAVNDILSGIRGVSEKAEAEAATAQGVN